MAESEEWELSKENIRPIQRGRKQNVLKVALASHPEEVIAQQRQSFENELRTYSGNDPLSVWWKYIKWVEQNYPKGGREGHIKQLVERCLSILKDEQKYFNDERFVYIMLKYANISEKPLDVYNYMHSNKIGCNSAEFYMNWAWELEQLGSLKKADDVLIEGIKLSVQPLQNLESYYCNFQVRLATKIKANLEKNNSEPEGGRSAFAMLKPQKRNLAPIMRTGEAVIENNKSSLILGRQQPQPRSTLSSVKVPFKIYDSENIDPSLSAQTLSGARHSLNPENYKENEQKPSKWSKVKVKSHGQSLKSLNEVNPDFKFHCDDDESNQICTPRSVPKTSNILSKHRRTPSPPMALFEPPDPMKKAMYPKNKVYGGAEEYSLEEIRAAEWLERKKKYDQEMLLAEQQKKIQEQAMNEEKLKKQVEILSKKVELLKSNFPCSDSKPSEILSASEVKATEFNVLLNNHIDKLIVQDENIHSHVHNNTNSEHSLRNNLHNDNSLSKNTTNYYIADKMMQGLYNDTLPHSTNSKNLNSNLQFDKKLSLFSSNNSLSDELPRYHDTHTIAKESVDKLPFTFYQDPTTQIIPHLDGIIPSEEIGNVITAKQSSEIDNISKDSNKLPFSFFNDSTEDVNAISEEFSKLNVANESKVQIISKESNHELPFTFYTDPTDKVSFNTDEIVSSTKVLNQKDCLPNLSQINQVNLSTESTNRLPFTFYQDPTSIIPNSVETITVEEAANKENPPHEESFDDDSENIPPKGYVQEKTERQLAGILQPSTNIEFLPLEQQDNDDDDDFEDDYIYQNERQCPDVTLFPPSNTEQFSTAKFLASTPCVARSSKTSNSEISKHEAVSPEEIIPENVFLPSENSNSGKKDLDSVKNVTKLEIKSFKEPELNTELKMTCHSRLPNMLSVIMETSSENYSKSSSNSSASLTKSNNLDPNSACHSLQRQQSKLEPCETSIASSISEVSNYNPEINRKKHNEKNAEKIQLYLVDFDPFDQKVTERLLKSIDFSNYKNIYTNNKSIRFVKMGENVCIGNNTYIVDSLIAEGAYAKVFKAMKSFGMCDNYTNKPLAFKVCKKANQWEFYICCEIHRRLSEKKLIPDVTYSVMNIMSAIKYPDGLLLVNEYFNFGTLLDVINFYKKQNSPIPEFLVMLFTLEILNIVSKLHECNIIHGDIKPDNFLLTPSITDNHILEKLSESTSYLRLIDFGRAIDLNLYDKGICFTTTFSAAHFKCNEMKENKPWVFQLDWYGVLSCIHTMLFLEYMTVKKKDDIWVIEKKFKRYSCTSLWEPLFNKLLNIPKCYEEPDIAFFINMIESKLQQNASAFIGQLSRFSSSYSKKK